MRAHLFQTSSFKCAGMENNRGLIRGRTPSVQSYPVLSSICFERANIHILSQLEPCHEMERQNIRFRRLRWSIKHR